MDEMDAKLQVAQEAGIIESDTDFYTLFNTTRLLSENAIPVPMKLGARLKEQHEATVAVYKEYHDDWKRAIKAFNEEGSMSDYEKEGVAKHNFVRQTVQSLIDFTYMRNPDAEFTGIRDIAVDSPEEKFVNALSATLNVVISGNNIHGIGLRKFIQRQIVSAHLTNYGVVKLDYINKAGSLNDVRELYGKVKEQIKTEEDEQKLEQLYSLLERLSEEMQNRRPMGLYLKNTPAFMFFIDPSCTKDDLSDASFCFEYEYLKISHIQSEYLTYNEQEQCWYYRYDKNKKFDGGPVSTSNVTDRAKEKIIEDLMPEATEKEIEYAKKDAVLCVWWYDRITKQKYLYMVDQWETPLWVFEDEQQLSQFFPYFLLAMSPSVGNILRRSEVSYYLPHQIRVNENAAQKDFIRANAFSTYVYNAGMVDPKEVKKMTDQMARPRKSSRIRTVPVKLSSPEAKVEDLLKPLIPPTAQFTQLFDDSQSVDSIQRMTKINKAFTGGEFKTNTTNDAIAQYSMATETKFSSLTDTIEESTARIFWAITEVIVSKFGKDYVTTIIGEKGNFFQQLSVEDFNSQYIMRIEAGSTEKPNSDAKKREAVQIIQMLGQFGTAAPMTIISIVAKMLRKVFSRHMVADQDLDMLKQEGTAAMQKGVSTQPGATTNV